MKNELLSIGPFTIYGYGLMIGIGIIAAYLTAESRAKKLKLDPDKIFGLVIWCLIFGYLGSKILFCITVIDKIIADPAYILHSLQNGWVVYGGLIGGIIGGCLYCRHKKVNFMSYFDLAVPSVALAQGFGRIGCFLAGCCYGRPTDGPLGITFTHSDFAPNGVSLIPTQEISSLLNFLNFFCPDQYCQEEKGGRPGRRFLSDFLQYRSVHLGVLPGRFGKRKCRKPVHLPVYSNLYFNSRYSCGCSHSDDGE